MPDRIPTDRIRSGQVATESAPALEHDATLLVAALEDVASRRAAMEWLLEADLLCRCLV